MIDLTCQSQSLTNQEELNSDNSISILQQVSSSPDVLQTLKKGITHNEITVSPICQTSPDRNVTDNLSGHVEVMDINAVSQSSFCLQVSPSQKDIFQNLSPIIIEQSTSPIQSITTIVANPCLDSNVDKHSNSPMNSIEISLQKTPVTSTALVESGNNNSGLVIDMEQGPLYESLRELSGNNGSNTVPSQEGSTSTGNVFDEK